MLVMTFNLEPKITNVADGLLEYLAKKLCPTRPASCLVNIKPGLTNALIREKIYLQACTCIVSSKIQQAFEKM